MGSRYNVLKMLLFPPYLSYDNLVEAQEFKVLSNILFSPLGQKHVSFKCENAEN